MISSGVSSLFFDYAIFQRFETNVFLKKLSSKNNCVSHFWPLGKVDTFNEAEGKDQRSCPILSCQETRQELPLRKDGQVLGASYGSC